VGPTLSGECLTWQEIDAYIRRSIAILSPGACEAIISASKTFVSAQYSYDGYALPPPYGEQAKQGHRNRVSAAIMAGFKQMIGT
jgi:hypothetical protein